MNQWALRATVIAGLLLSTSCATTDQGPTSRSDCDVCPTMVLVPSGSFEIGSDPSSPGHISDEAPQKTVTLDAFWASQHEITVGQYKAFVEATGYVGDGICLVMPEVGGWVHDPEADWSNPGFEQADDHPAVCVSWNGAQAYVAWLNEITGDTKYRLLSESEWEYAARAGSTTTYWWGEDEDAFCDFTNGVDQSARAQFPAWERSGNCDDGFVFTAPVGHYGAPNPFGLEDMVGNVWEWVDDCYVASFDGLPSDGRPQMPETCERRVLRGGAWGDYGSFYLRSAYRGAFVPEWAFTNLGFRVARSQ